MSDLTKLLIKNGLIYDGSGQNPFHGNIYVEDRLIKRIWKGHGVETEPKIIPDEVEVVDAEGKMVTPGFVDIHRHCDIRPFFGTDFGVPLLAQGITTVVVGNCGFSMVPVSEDEARREDMEAFAAPVMGTAYSGIHTFETDMRELDRRKLPVNVASMIGTGTVRTAVKGFSDTPFTDDEMAKACSCIEAALVWGAVGVSAGIMYLPECYNSVDDYVRMLSPLKEYGVPLCVHIRGEGDSLVDSVREVIEIGRRVGCPVEISHFKSCGMSNWRKEIHRAIALIETARKDGQDVTCDFYPYQGGSTALTTMIPPAFVAGDMKQALEKLGTREGVEEFGRALDVTYRDWDNYAISLGWDKIMISGVTKKENQKFVGKMVSDITEEYHFSREADFVAWLLHDENGKVAIINMSMCREDTDTIAKLPYSCVISDSIYGKTDTPHPRMYGAFPKIIREYVLERGVLTMQEAVRKMTSLPAERMKLVCRGMIKEGYFADINIFSPEKVRDLATFQHPTQLAQGMWKTFVNGQLAWSEGRMILDAGGRNLHRGEYG